MTEPAALPVARGPLSAFVLEHLTGPVRVLPRSPRVTDDPLSGDDLHLALHTCYELPYRRFRKVSDEGEGDPSLLAFRAELEGRFLEGLRDAVGRPTPPVDIEAALHELIASADGPSLSSYVLEHGTLEQVREFAVHRSIYQLKEADPHTWGIPRLDGVAKAAMAAIQADEYGNGEATAMHSSLFARTMEALGLDPTYGAYLDAVPGVTLATSNLVSMFGLHRRWRGALVGHLAVFEMTSVVPMSRYAATLRRLGLGA